MTNKLTIEVNALINHLVQNKSKKTQSDKELIAFYKRKRKELIAEINNKLATIL